MVTKHTDIYYCNKYGNRFTTEEGAINDEVLRDTCPFKVKQLEPQVYFNQIQGSGVEALNDYGKPFTGQMGDRSTVYFFKDMIPKMQEMIERYGGKYRILQSASRYG